MLIWIYALFGLFTMGMIIGIRLQNEKGLGGGSIAAILLLSILWPLYWGSFAATSSSGKEGTKCHKK